MKVTPKTTANYKYIELWIDKEGMPVQTKMVEKNDDSTTVRLTNVARNQTISRGRAAAVAGGRVAALTTDPVGVAGRA